jgi:tetratricopeptide (TPR) repeat protein
MLRRWLWLGLGLGIAALGWSVWRTLEGWRSRSALQLAKQEMARGHYALAGARLARLSARWSGWDEADYLLGVCEASAGRPDSALAVWARVPAGSPFTIQAIVRRARVEMGRGRFAAAERILLAALRDPRRDAPGARHILAELLWQQGRYDEVTPLFEANWEVVTRPDWRHPEDALELLRAHIALDLFPMPIERVRAALSRAEALAPDDDRVWLARAHLATRTGQYAEAERRLGDCLHRRPDDPAVWRARLDWAQAADRVDEALRALDRIPS